MKLQKPKGEFFTLFSLHPLLWCYVPHRGGAAGFQCWRGLVAFVSSNFHKVLNRVLLISDAVFSTCATCMHARASASGPACLRDTGGVGTHTFHLCVPVADFKRRTLVGY